MSHQNWYHWRSPAADAPLNMGWDEACLLRANRLPGPLLRFYQWQNEWASFGYFQRFEDAAKLSPTPHLTRRMSGGGLVSHIDDWTYSLVFPSDSDWYLFRAKESYIQLHRWIRHAFQSLGFKTHLNSKTSKTSKTKMTNVISVMKMRMPKTSGECFMKAEENDLLFCGRKLAGAAQRRTKHGLLIQGSIQSPPRQIAQIAWQNALLETAHLLWKIDWQPWRASKSFAEKAEQIAASKFATTQHTKRR